MIEYLCQLQQQQKSAIFELMRTPMKEAQWFRESAGRYAMHVSTKVE